MGSPTAQAKSPIRSLIEEQERALLSLSGARQSNLQQALREREEQLAQLRMRFSTLREDSQYNLQLLEARDKELAAYESSSTALRESLESKEAQLQQCRAALATLEQQVQREGAKQQHQEQQQSEQQQRWQQEKRELQQQVRCAQRPPTEPSLRDSMPFLHPSLFFRIECYAPRLHSKSPSCQVEQVRKEALVERERLQAESASYQQQAQEAQQQVLEAQQQLQEVEEQVWELRVLQHHARAMLRKSCIFSCSRACNDGPDATPAAARLCGG